MGSTKKTVEDLDDDNSNRHFTQKTKYHDMMELHDYFTTLESAYAEYQNAHPGGSDDYYLSLKKEFKKSIKDGTILQDNDNSIRNYDNYTNCESDVKESDHFKFDSDDDDNKDNSYHNILLRYSKMKFKGQLKDNNIKKSKSNVDHWID